ncbi:alpha/beta hydrolase family protein [Snuella lapsa]|uniref:Alpha/beta fold hydrolase n=1 Tax=Snuella lapsa TaxID=870481 RepID=A0ABP6XUN1_9FLAO
MIIDKNTIIKTQHGKPILVDLFYLKNKQNKPIVIFCHGYKGFKDWGAWDLMAKTFANAGFLFIKFNFSHNGGTIEQPIDFPDLEAFAHNNYTKELNDLDTVISWVFKNSVISKEGNLKAISLIGHSRGGGIVAIKAEEDSRIKALIGLASVSDFKSRFPTGEAFTSWQQNGVYYVVNGRTKQNMPHYFQFYEDFAKNEEHLTIKRAVSKLNIPYLIIHGDDDSSVRIEEAKELHKWRPDSTLKIIANANHVFGASHPWDKPILPEQLKTVINQIITFIKDLTFYIEGK